MSAAAMVRVVPSSNMMRYWGEEPGSSGMSITVPARFCPGEDDVQDSCPRWVRFTDGGVVVAMERNEEAAIVLDCWMNG